MTEQQLQYGPGGGSGTNAHYKGLTEWLVWQVTGTPIYSSTTPGSVSMSNTAIDIIQKRVMRAVIPEDNTGINIYASTQLPAVVPAVATFMGSANYKPELPVEEGAYKTATETSYIE